MSNQGDKVDRNTASRRLQTARYIQNTEVEGRLHAAFLQFIEYGDMHDPKALFLDPSEDGSRCVDKHFAVKIF